MGSGARLASNSKRALAVKPGQGLDYKPVHDLIGPPCPLSNLRPVFYAPLFPAFRNHGSPSHPYSVEEFPDIPTLSHKRQLRLQQTKRDLYAADLEWRLTRYRADSFNQDFWARTNANFLQARDAYLSHLKSSNNNNQNVSSDTPKNSEDLAPFYANHLASTKTLYAEYNRALWRSQGRLLWLAVKANMRRFRWKLELWRAGGEQGNLV